ncbi:hypothetical protein AB0B28_02865 [Glycomyces sp. NPDC046736]|uniref:hypothetical protein n=1 Tax=Glycomyces sp. NPDC046736 TaxID=3155615 RepID=UPI0033CC8D68
MTLRYALAAAVLAALAYGMLAGLGTGAPDGVTADCFHLAPDGTIADCPEAPEPAPTAAVQAANWAWWGPAAAPVTLGALVIAAWFRIRARFARSSEGASRAPSSG